VSFALSASRAYPPEEEETTSMQRFRQAVESGDSDAMVASLAEDVVFQSPIVFKPYRGREMVGRLLRAVATVFSDFRYLDELRSEGQTALVFAARVGDRDIEGIDLLQVDAAGLVAHLTVFVRPLSAAQALAAAMQAALTVG
jgi:ketosteroid isomerase-like protein